MNKFLEIGRFGLWLLVLVGWLATGCASSKEYAFSPLPVDSSETADIDQAKDQFAVGNIVIVKFSAKDCLIPPHRERIKEDGMITLPLIGPVKAADKLPFALQREIRGRYVPEFFQGVAIAVEKERYYYVDGQVNIPGRRVCPGEMTITKAIESAGGFTELSERHKVYLVRFEGRTLVVDCVKAEQDPYFDLPVYPGDRIDVHSRPPANFMRRLGF